MFHDGKINAFLILAETLSYTKTAKQLFMSQQAISRVISVLEQDLNTQLFLRTTRTVKLTPAGQKYYKLFSQINRACCDGIEQIQAETEGGKANTIRLGVQSYMDVAPILRAVDVLSKAAPDYAVQITAAPPSVLLDQFERHLVDFTILLERFLPDGFDATRCALIVNPLYLFVSDKNPKATDDASLDDLLTLPYISDMLEGEDNVAHQARMKHEADMWGLVPNETIWAYDRDSVLMYAELGYGIVIDSLKSRMVRNRALKVFKTDKTESLLLLYRENQLENRNFSIMKKAFEDAYIEEESNSDN